MSWPTEVRLRVAEDPEPVRLRVGEVIVAGDAPPYRGAYEVTPGEQAQVLPTAGTQAMRDIVVGAIPSNYGRIEWNGHRIRVS